MIFTNFTLIQILMSSFMVSNSLFQKEIRDLLGNQWTTSSFLSILEVADWLPSGVLAGPL